MRKLLIGIAGLVLGVALGAFGGVNLGGGAMMGAGVATGLSAGICSTVQAAQEEGIMTAEQVDLVLARAASDMAAAASLPAGTEMVGGAADCASFLDRLKAGVNG